MGTASVAAVAWPGRGVARPWRGPAVAWPGRGVARPWRGRGVAVSWRAYSVQLAFRGAQPPSDLRSVP